MTSRYTPVNGKSTKCVELPPLVHECSRLASYNHCRATGLSETLDERRRRASFHSIVRPWRSRSPPPPCGSRPLEALTCRRPQGTRVGHTNSFRRRISRFDQSRSSASTQRHLTSATEHERALTRRELALRAVVMVGADRHYRNSQRQRYHARVPPQESPPCRAAGAWRVVVTTSRHVPHSAAPLARRPTVRGVVE